MRLLSLLVLAGCPTENEEPKDSGGTAAAPGCQRLSAAPDTLHWEDVVTGTAVTDVVAVTNTCSTGADSLTFTASISEASFTVDVMSVTVLAPGESQDLAVTFAPTDTVSHYGALVLDSDDPDSPQQFVSLEGLVTTDADGDSFANEASGGDDCDDTDPAVHPGANEVWYDGADQDCDGSDDYDQDGDGWPSAGYGGSDCNDLSAAIHPGADEALDDVDQDCDGMVDEDFVLSGEVLPTEVMPTPGTVADADGEWLEVTNVGTGSIDLFGWTITNSFGQTWTVDRHVAVPGNGQAVLGGSVDSLANGGVHVDVAWDQTAFSLGASDGVVIAVDTRTIGSTSWSSAPQGIARQLDPDHLDAAGAAGSEWWCDASLSISGGDLGTPAEPNSQCTSVDEDGDGVSEDDGDCDDSNAAIHAGATDTWDGVDDDCDGIADDPAVDTVATATIEGSSSYYLGGAAGIGTADLTGDGTDDLVLGSTYAASYAGYVWLIDSADVIGASATVSSIDTATVYGNTYSYSGMVPPRMTDQTGDGTSDLVVVGTPYVYYGGSGASLYRGGATLSGVVDTSEAVVTIDSDDTYGYGVASSAANLDFNGDGIAELVRGSPYSTGGSMYYTGTVLVWDVDGAAGELTSDDALATLSGTDSAGYLGWSVGGGDTDGDGYDDLSIGAPGLNSAASTGGGVYLVSGSQVRGTADAEDLASTVIYGSNAGDRIGSTSPIVADFDGSGGLDLAISGSGADAVYVFSGAGSLAAELETTDADTTITGSNTFGFSLFATDVNGDGETDLAVGSPAINPTYSSSYAWYYTKGVAQGSVWFYDRTVLSAGGSHASTEAFRGLTGVGSDDLFGACLGAGDFDADGVDDVVVSAPQTGTAAGTAYVVLGN